MRVKIILLCPFCILAVCANALALGGGAITTYYNPNNDISAEEAAEQNAARADQARQQMIQNFIPRDPWCVVNGVTNYVKLLGVEFCGKVVDITPNGVRIEGQYGTLCSTSYDPANYSSYNDFFVANFPFEVVDGQIISSDEHLMAWYVGTYAYATVNGGSRTIKKLEYGIPCGPAPEFIQQQIEAAKAKAVLDKQKAEQGQINAFHWLQSQATNGDVGAQCSLGLHYLNGQGCETNQEQAIFWLQKSAAQGDIEASNKLVSLQKP
jgi:TPR repeat protein